MQQCLGVALYVLTHTLWPICSRIATYGVLTRTRIYTQYFKFGDFPAKQNCYVEHGIWIL